MSKEKSKAVLEHIKQFADALSIEVTSGLVLGLCCGEPLDYIDGTIGGLVRPEPNGRGYSDPTYRAEYDAYSKERDALYEKVVAEFGYEHLEQEGGGEGGAEYCYGVFKLGDKYYRGEWSYYSHVGYEYDYIRDTLEEVFPEEQTIVVYKPKA